jgi:23S rRNA (adenine2503-C2)-methyltransferase
MPAGIKRFGKDFPQTNLAVSLVSAIDKKRSELMPINKRHNLEELRKALSSYLEKTKRKV